MEVSFRILPITEDQTAQDKKAEEKNILNAPLKRQRLSEGIM